MDIAPVNNDVSISLGTELVSAAEPTSSPGGLPPQTPVLIMGSPVEGVGSVDWVENFWSGLGTYSSKLKELFEEGKASAVSGQTGQVDLVTKLNDATKEDQFKEMISVLTVSNVASTAISVTMSGVQTLFKDK